MKIEIQNHTETSSIQVQVEKEFLGVKLKLMEAKDGWIVWASDLTQTPRAALYYHPVAKLWKIAFQVIQLGLTIQEQASDSESPEDEPSRRTISGEQELRDKAINSILWHLSDAKAQIVYLDNQIGAIRRPWVDETDINLRKTQPIWDIQATLAMASSV